MKAVNLIPAESRRSTGFNAGLSISPAYAVLGLLAIAVAFAAVYVTSGNSIATHRAELQTLQGEIAAAQAQAASYDRYAQFASLAQQRLTTVREIANTRFDWHEALTNLSRVVPGDTALSALSATVSPATSSAGSGGAAGGLRGYGQGPAFELSGCTKTQDDVARLMSRLRLIDGVTRVTLNDAQKSNSAAGGASVTTTGSAAAGCGSNAPTFDLLVFFAPIPGALATAPATTPSAPTPTGSTTTTTATATPSPTTTTSTTAQPVSSTTTTGTP